MTPLLVEARTGPTPCGVAHRSHVRQPRGDGHDGRRTRDAAEFCHVAPYSEAILFARGVHPIPRWVQSLVGLCFAFPSMFVYNYVMWSLAARRAAGRT